MGATRIKLKALKKENQQENLQLLSELKFMLYIIKYTEWLIQENEDKIEVVVW